MMKGKQRTFNFELSRPYEFHEEPEQGAEPSKLLEPPIN